MKCIKLHGEVRRVTDDVAAKLVQQGWNYCPKSDWKATKGRQSETAVVPEKTEKKSKKGKKAKKSDENTPAPNPDPVVVGAVALANSLAPNAPVMPETKAKKAKAKKEAEAKVDEAPAKAKKNKKN